MPNTVEKRYHDFNAALRSQFGCRVQKITVDAGFTCPNRDGTLSRGGCVYCNPRGSGTGAHAMGHSITEQLEAGKMALARRYKAKLFIAYFQSFTNTYAPLARLEAVYREALSVPGIVGLSIGTRPDCVGAPVASLLETYARKHLIWVELGLQSAHDRTLDRIHRGHNAADFSQAVKRLQGRGMRICAHVILGLPGETQADMMETADFIADLNIDGAKIHLLYVIKGTPLATQYRQGEFRCLEQDEYVDAVCGFLERLPDTVVIQRLTGDPHPDELVAPEWSLRKADTLTRIQQMLVDRDTWQGRLRGAKMPISIP